MIIEYTLQEFDYTAKITLYKGIWRANLQENILYALTGIKLKEYLYFIELVDSYLNTLNKKVG